MGGGFRGIGGFYMCSLGGSFGISFRDGSFKVRPRHRRKLIVEVEHSPILTTRALILHIRLLDSATESGGQSDIWGFDR
jgi:hypothetical protein